MLIPVNRYGAPPNVKTVPLRLTNAAFRLGAGVGRRVGGGGWVCPGVGTDVPTGRVAEFGALDVEGEVGVGGLEVETDVWLRRPDACFCPPGPECWVHRPPTFTISRTRRSPPSTAALRSVDAATN